MLRTHADNVVEIAIGPHSTLIGRVRELYAFPDESEAQRIVAGLRWMGLFSREEQATVRGGNLLDTFCARLEALVSMRYRPGERDLVVLQQKFVVEWADGKTVRRSLSVFFYCCGIHCRG